MFDRRLTTRVFALLLILGAAAAGTGQSNRVPAPRIDIPNDYFYFGYMPINAIVQHVYWIRNAGVDTLQIFKVKPSCGCTNAPLTKDRIAPGDSSLLKVTFDSKNMIGKMVKEVEIYSNDPQKPTAVIKFFAMVNREHEQVRANPNTLRFSKFGSKDGRMVRPLEISNGTSQTIEVKIVEFPAEFFKIDRNTVSIRPGQKGIFTVEQVKSAVEEVDVMSSLTVEFVGSETDRLTVPLVAHLQR